MWQSRTNTNKINFFSSLILVASLQAFQVKEYQLTLYLKVKGYLKLKQWPTTSMVSLLLTC